MKLSFSNHTCVYDCGDDRNPIPPARRRCGICGGPWQPQSTLPSGIVEFETSPEPYYDDKPMWRWHGKVSVDLQWVAGAQIYAEFTSILLAGSQHWFTINCPYGRFMEMWMAARKGTR